MQLRPSLNQGVHSMRESGCVLGGAILTLAGPTAPFSQILPRLTLNSDCATSLVDCASCLSSGTPRTPASQTARLPRCATHSRTTKVEPHPPTSGHGAVPARPWLKLPVVTLQVLQVLGRMEAGGLR